LQEPTVQGAGEDALPPAPRERGRGDMQHLSDGALARLADEEATVDEALHLAHCERCRAEVDALVEQTRMLGRLPDLAPPAGAWPALAGRLAAEGLPARPASRWRRPLARAAAALALFLGGAAVGALVPPR